MTLAEIVGWWPQIVSAAGGLGGGGAITSYLSHQRAKRKQTDDVALGMVEKLQARISEVEAAAATRIDAVEKASVQERLLCDAKLDAADHKLSVLRHELGNVENSFDGLLLAIRFAPPERIPEIVEIAQQQRAERSTRKGEARNAAQIELSAHRVIPDLD
jgi:acetylornithine/succinyldiaminopimelate/putrescine aminotransferase